MKFFNRNRSTDAALKPVCAGCGSDDVEAHAYCSWDVATQGWKVKEVLEDGSCSGCGCTSVKLLWQGVAPKKPAKATYVKYTDI